MATDSKENHEKGFAARTSTEVAIIGAGPYGLSIAAHFRAIGIPFRIFGRPMDSWISHMPTGMMLKSDNFASNISDPNGDFTLKHFCAAQGIEYADTQRPVSLATFSAYGVAFKERMVPELEDKLVVALERVRDGFLLRLDTEETVTARRVVLAVGITHFEYVPANLAHLPPEYLSHSFHHRDLEPFRGRDVVVIGGGASASDLAGLLYEAGAKVQLVARRETLKFHSQPPVGKRRSLWKRIRHPQSGLGPGLRSRIYADAPHLFRYLSKSARLRIVKQHLGPAGGWFAKEKVMGKVPLALGCNVESAEVQNGRVRLQLRSADGGRREITAEHVIAATGYRADVDRLKFLSEDIRTNLETFESTPVLSSKFESSIPGLYFVGIAAANTFGPLMRFAFGADFVARLLARTMAKSFAKNRMPASVSVPVTIAK
jgi:thioredoxin reductase